MTDLNLKSLQEAHDYERGHLVRAVRDLCLSFATGASLVSVLDDAWRAGYRAHEQEQEGTVRRGEPSKGVLQLARSAVKRSTSFRRLALGEWTWVPENACWSPDNEDSTIRPGDDGAVIVMAAGGEWAGVIVTPDGSEFRFPAGTFR